MPRTRRGYPPEFRRQMVELVRSGRSPEELAREFEPSAQSIRNWVCQRDLDEGRRADGLTTEDHAELREEGERVGRHRVARLMRRADLQGVSRRRGVRTTVRSTQGSSAPDLVDRNFEVAGPDRLWVADITYIPTWTGFLYLAVVL